MKTGTRALDADQRCAQAPRRPLARQRRPLSPILVHNDRFIRIGRRYHAAVELDARDGRAHGQGRGDQREEHQRTTEDGEPDEGKETDDHYDVVNAIEGRTISFRTLPRRNLQGTAGEQLPQPFSAHTEHPYMHSGRWMFAGDTRRHAVARGHTPCQLRLREIRK